MRDAAAAAGVHAVIGLQARANPAIRRACQLIEAGAIGSMVSARMISETGAFGTKTAESDFYLEDPANGATQMTIHAGHGIDALIAVLGDLLDVAVLASTQFPEVEVVESGVQHRRTISDHFFVQSHLVRGGVVSAEFAGGRPNARFHFEIIGDQGILAVQGAALLGFQSGRLSLSLNGETQTIDDGELRPMPDTAYNVGALYAQLRDDVASDGALAPDFAHAVRLTTLIEQMTAVANDANAARAVTDSLAQPTLC